MYDLEDPCTQMSSSSSMKLKKKNYHQTRNRKKHMKALFIAKALVNGRVRITKTFA